MSLSTVYVVSCCGVINWYTFFICYSLYTTCISPVGILRDIYSFFFTNVIVLLYYRIYRYIGSVEWITEKKYFPSNRKLVVDSHSTGFLIENFHVILHNGMEMNVEKTKVMRISRQPSPVTFMTDQKQLENVECFKYLGSMLTNDGRCTCEIKSRIAMAKAAFKKKKKKKILFTSKLDLNLRKKLVKCYIWSMAFYGAETWTLRAADKKYLESLKCGAGEG